VSECVCVCARARVRAVCVRVFGVGGWDAEGVRARTTRRMWFR
jgi:hypothetical protein